MLKRAIRWLPALLLFAAAGPLYGQATPEGTAITNTATVRYTDANGTERTSDPATATVLVGFVASVDVDDPTATPRPGTTGNNVVFTVTNQGNGVDTIQVNSLAADPGVTITDYLVNGVSIGSTVLGDLNTALALIEVAGNGSDVTITVVYDIDAGTGGQSFNVDIVVASKRDSGETDAGTATITPSDINVDEVLDDNGDPIVDEVIQLPNGPDKANYTLTYTITNNTGATADFDVAAVVSNDNASVVVVSVTGVDVTAGVIEDLAAGASTDVIVTYTVGDEDRGLSSDIDFSVVYDAGGPNEITTEYTVTVYIRKPLVTVTKEMFELPDGVDAIAENTDVFDGDVIWYRVTITNTNDATYGAEAEIELDDVHSEFLVFGDGAGNFAASDWDADVPADWGLVYDQPSRTITATLTPALTNGSSRVIWFKMTVDVVIPPTP